MLALRGSTWGSLQDMLANDQDQVGSSSLCIVKHKKLGRLSTNIGLVRRLLAIRLLSVLLLGLSIRLLGLSIGLLGLSVRLLWLSPLVLLLRRLLRLVWLLTILLLRRLLTISLRRRRLTPWGLGSLTCRR